MKPASLVSIHGGHSGQFCDHARDTLEKIIRRYIELGFTWVGITEHTPPISDNLLDPGQRKLGFTAESLLEKFADYFVEIRRLKQLYRDRLEIFAAMEIETYSGYRQFVPFLVKTFQPDYFVGSVHFVGDINFDYSEKLYRRAIDSAGSIDNLYLKYFDLQYEMIDLLNPPVVGHFDLIRIFDPDYRSRLLRPDINRKIERNLELIRQKDLILDLNLRALYKGNDEPYISRRILEKVREMEIAVVPGDDSHSVDSVGNHMTTAIELLRDMGFSTEWRKPGPIL
ncbi:histidinol-phosphatase [Desulforhopalus singaporensis]|nr:histidinol-phosphatase [Desulforhopalus singaporensis]